MEGYLSEMESLIPEQQAAIEESLKSGKAVGNSGKLPGFFSK